MAGDLKWITKHRKKNDDFKEQRKTPVVNVIKLF